MTLDWLRFLKCDWKIESFYWWLKNKSHQHQGKSHVLQIPCHFQWNVFSIIVLMKEFITKRVGIANMLNVIFSSRSSTQRFSFTLSWTQRNFHTNWFFEANENYFWTFCVTEQRRFDRSSINLCNISSFRCTCSISSFYAFLWSFHFYDNNLRFSINTKYPSDEMKSKNESQRSKCTNIDSWTIRNCIGLGHDIPWEFL